MMWVLGAVLLVLAVGGITLQFAISRNGPAVLSAVDRLVGNAENTLQLERVNFGDHPAQKLLVWGTSQNRDSNTKGANAKQPAPKPVLIFIHGGSWRSGDPDDYGFIARAFVPKGFIVVLAGYRLHPDAVYPAMLQDAASVIAWTRQEIAQYGGDPDHIVIAGHSAGAYNVAMAALQPEWLENHAMSPAVIKGVVGLSGPYDFYPFDSSSTINSFGQADDPHITQPINHTHRDQPPFLLVHGEKDTLVRPRNTRELAARSQAAGAHVKTQFYPEMSHNDPVISLAAPWRGRSDLADLIANFAKDPKASVSVQAKIR